MRVISFNTKTTPQQALRFAEREVHIRAHGSDVYCWGRPINPEESYASRLIQGETGSKRSVRVTLQGSGQRASYGAPNCWESATIAADFGSEGSHQFALNILDALLLEGVFPEKLVSTWGVCERGMDSWNNLAKEVVQQVCWTNHELAQHLGKLAGIPAQIVDRAVDDWVGENGQEQILMGPLSEQRPKAPARAEETLDDEFVEDMLLELTEENEGQ